MNTLYKLLDRLESVIMDGIPIPLLPYSLVNQEKLIMILDKIQTALPEEVQQADQILERKEEIQLEAQRRAQQILQEAKLQAEKMLHESELLKAVHLEAERIRQQVMTELQAIRQQTLEETEDMRRRAFEESKVVRDSSDEYAETVLKTLTKSLDEFQNIAKNGQKQLKKVMTEGFQMQYPDQTIQSNGYPVNKKQPKPSQQRPSTSGRSKAYPVSPEHRETPV